MGERKVLNKYHAPDFDPKLIPRAKKPKGALQEVRLMLPFSMACTTCGEFMYRGKKFNSKKEEVTGEDYLGIKLWRFYIKCCACSQEIAFRTDPKNADYTLERGASRNYEAWRDGEEVEGESEERRKGGEEKADAMKALENRTLASKREMEVLDALDEIRSLNRRHEQAGTVHALLMKRAEERAGLHEADEEDEALIKSIKFGRGPTRVSHLLDDDEDDEGERRLGEEERLSRPESPAARERAPQATTFPVVMLKKRKKAKGAEARPPRDPKCEDGGGRTKKLKAEQLSSGPTGLVGLDGYGSESDG